MSIRRLLLAGTTALCLPQVAAAQQAVAPNTASSPDASRVDPVQQTERADPGLPSTGRTDDGLSVPAQTSQGGLGDIVVTARKRSESVQKVPIAVSVASAQSLDQHQITEAYQLTAITPSLQVSSINSQVGAANFSIRGLGTAIYGSQVESSVGVVIDDVVMSRPQFGAIEFFDIDRVEVLRGPQGMLFGKNASAGLINIVTGVPVLGKTEFLAHLDYANANSGSSGNNGTVEAAVNLPTGKDSALRLSGFVIRKDGYAKNVFQSEDLGMTEFGARAKFLWRPTSAFTLTLGGDYVHENGPAESVIIRGVDMPGGFIQRLNAQNGIVATDRNTKVAGDAPTFNKFDVGGVSAKADYEFSNGMTLTDIAAYRKYKSRYQLDTDVTSLDLFNLNAGAADMWQVSNELRLASPTTGRLNYQVGLYYLHLRADGFFEQGANLSTLAPAPPAGTYLLGAYSPALSHTTSYAGFGEAQFKITDNFRLTAGGRFTHDEIDLRVSVQNPRALVSLYQFALGDHYNKTRQDNFSYRVGLDYSLSPDVLLYATYSRGYKAPTFDQLAADPVGQEISKSIEGGIKSTLLDRRLRLNLAIYNTLFEGYQAQIARTTGGLGVATVNAGTLRAQGVEAEFTALPFRGLTLSGGVTYNDATYRNFGGLPCYFNQPTGTSGLNVCLPNGTTNISGNQIVNAPRWTVSTTARYEHDVSSSLKGFLQGDVYYRTRFRFSPTLDPNLTVGQSAIVGASAGVATKDDRVNVSIFVRNLTDRRIPSNLIADPISGAYGDLPSGDYFQQFSSASFRTIGVSLGLRL